MGRTEKSIKNIIFGFIAQAVSTALLFVSKSVMKYALGDDVIAINSLYKEVISFMSLTELGIGSAIVYDLYKPLAEGNKERVCQLITFFKKAYRIIAVAILGIGAIVCFFVPLFVKDLSFDVTYERIVFLFFVANTAVSYLYSYKISLLNADQKSYMYSMLSSILNVVTTLIQVAVMLIWKNFYVLLAVNIGITFLNNFIVSRFVDKVYPYLKDDELPKENRKKIFDNVKNIFIKEMSGKITSSTDNMLISIMVSTVMVGKNSWYTTVIGVFKRFIEQIETGIRASMGNLFVSGSNADCKRVLYRLTWMYGVSSVFVCTCIYASCQSFIAAWAGRENMMELYILFIITINLFCYVISKPIYAAMHVSGFFVEGRRISIIGSVGNLVVSIIFGYFTGIFGIFLGTFVTYLIQILMKIHYVYKLKFNESGIRYYLYLLQFTVVLVGLMFGCERLCSLMVTGSDILDFIVHGSVAAVITLGVLALLYCRTPEFKYYKELAFGYIKKIFGKREKKA